MNRLLITLVVSLLVMGPIIAEARGSRSHRGAFTHAQISQAQTELQAAGFNPGPVDGHLGPKTRGALRAYQQAHNLRQTGTLDRATRQSLAVSR
jgi:peptidoglycan hydrolase-like protein with peptidoglycan-binding domain